MIRSNLPIPFLYRLRLQAGSAARRAHSSLTAYRQPRGANGARPLKARQASARRFSATDASSLWLEFIEQYECFTGMLCAAAKSGCDSRKESEYAQLRRWFVKNYYRLAARVRPYLDTDLSAGELREPLMIADYAGQKRALDPLEALFLPPTLREVLGHDSGNLIPRVARISESVYRCHAEWEESQKTQA